jgi:hypothetical protein
MEFIYLTPLALACILVPDYWGFAGLQFPPYASLGKSSKHPMSETCWNHMPTELFWGQCLFQQAWHMLWVNFPGLMSAVRTDIESNSASDRHGTTIRVFLPLHTGCG